VAASASSNIRTLSRIWWRPEDQLSLSDASVTNSAAFGVATNGALPASVRRHSQQRGAAAAYWRRRLYAKTVSAAWHGGGIVENRAAA